MGFVQKTKVRIFSVWTSQLVNKSISLTRLPNNGNSIQFVFQNTLNLMVIEFEAQYAFLRSSTVMDKRFFFSGLF